MRRRRISFNEYDAGHLYELALEHFVEGCFVCDSIKKRLERFIGKKEIGCIKRIVKKYPYNRIKRK